MKLYEIAADYANLLEAIERGDIPEEAIADTLESVVSILEDKADNIACMIKNLNAEAEAIKAEEKRLAERRKAKERQAEGMKEYLAETLLQAGYTKVETARNRISFRKNEKTVVDDEAAFIEWAQKHNDDLLTYSAPTVNKTAVKTAIANGVAVVGAHVEATQNIQIK